MPTTYIANIQQKPIIIFYKLFCAYVKKNKKHLEFQIFLNKGSLWLMVFISCGYCIIIIVFDKNLFSAIPSLNYLG